MERRNVEYNFLGRTGVKVSNVCLGTLTFGTSDTGLFPVFYSNPKQTDETASHEILDRFIELGGNFIDTADIYSDGNTERIVGTWLQKQKRDDIVLASKVGLPTDSNSSGNRRGLSRRYIVKSLNDSLERLQTDYIDLYQAHIWDNGTPLEETLTTFNDLVRSGKIRYYGYCNVTGWQMQKIVETTKRLNLEPCVTLQQQYSLLRRESELEAFMVCRNEGVGVLPWSPLKGGLLSGKYSRGVVPELGESRIGYMEAMKNEGKTNFSNWSLFKDDPAYWKLIEVLKKIADQKGRSVAQVALRWLIHRDVVSAVVIGCTSVKQLEENMAASGGWKLSSDEIAEVSEASQPNPFYPYDLVYGKFQDERSNNFVSRASTL